MLTGPKKTEEEKRKIVHSLMPRLYCIRKRERGWERRGAIEIADGWIGGLLGKL